MTTSTAHEPRQVIRLTRGMSTEDGAGVKLIRLVGSPEVPDIDPILMLDAFRSDDPKSYIAGFPPHPHRGFETVSYMIAGSLKHKDNKGGEGLITDGGVQWMTAGRGVVHSEMPAQTNGTMFGFQLWLNLPAAEKMRAPWYRDIAAAEIPQVELSAGVQMKLIAGTWRTTKGPAPERATQPLIADIALAAETRASIPIPQGHAAFAYVFEGKATLGSQPVQRDLTRGDLAVLSNNGDLTAITTQEAARILIVAAKPLREPIAKYGPFVMNTQDELRQAFNDFQRGQF
ncbi:MAG: pirin family protein [Alphaproteobacteria bacterium]|nr:pirin family protein [Alphaproteobacteria bacterium]